MDQVRCSRRQFQDMVRRRQGPVLDPLATVTKPPGAAQAVKELMKPPGAPNPAEEAGAAIPQRQDRPAVIRQGGDSGVRPPSGPDNE